MLTFSKSQVTKEELAPILKHAVWLSSNITQHSPKSNDVSGLPLLQDGLISLLQNAINGHKKTSLGMKAQSDAHHS